MTSACAVTITAGPDRSTFMLGTRDAAATLRAEVETALASIEAVCVDFRGVLVSQSFMDEFLGVLISRFGPDVLTRVILQNCHEEVRAAAIFVTGIRAREFMELTQVPASPIQKI